DGPRLTRPDGSRENDSRPEDALGVLGLVVLGEVDAGNVVVHRAQREQGTACGVLAPAPVTPSHGTLRRGARRLRVARTGPAGPGRRRGARALSYPRGRGDRSTRADRS